MRGHDVDLLVNVEDGTREIRETRISSNSPANSTATAAIPNPNISTTRRTPSQNKTPVILSSAYTVSSTVYPNSRRPLHRHRLRRGEGGNPQLFDLMVSPGSSTHKKEYLARFRSVPAIINGG